MRMKFRRFSPLVAEVIAVRTHLPVRPRKQATVDTRHHTKRRRHRSLLILLLYRGGEDDLLVARLAMEHETQFFPLPHEGAEDERMGMIGVIDFHGSLLHSC